MNEPRQHRMKSRIAVMKGSSLENKENVSRNANAKGNLVRDNNPGKRENLAAKNVDSQAKQKVKSRKVKNAPDFEKLHRKWESKLAKKKAITKRPNTKIEPFNLTKESLKEKIDKEDFVEVLSCSDCEDEVSTERPSNEIATDSGEQKRNEDVINGNAGKKEFVSPANRDHFKVPQSLRKDKSYSVRKMVEQSDHDLFEFKPDNNALNSILNNVGVDVQTIQATPCKTAKALFSPSPFHQKRTSIYYTGPRSNRSRSGFEQRLSMRLASPAVNEFRTKNVTETTLSRKLFEPSKTLVGIQEMENRFSVTPQKGERLHQASTLSCSGTKHSFSGARSNDISWAETLKSYSQFSSCDPQSAQPHNESQDTDALVAQLEEEVTRNLFAIELGNDGASSKEFPNPCSTSHTKTTDTSKFRNHPLECPTSQLQDHRGKSYVCSPSPSSADSRNRDNELDRETPFAAKRDSERTLSNFEVEQEPGFLVNWKDCSGYGSARENVKHDKVVQTPTGRLIPNRSIAGEMTSRISFNTNFGARHSIRSLSGLAGSELSAFSKKGSSNAGQITDTSQCAGYGHQINSRSGIVVPTPLRPAPPKQPSKSNLCQTASGFISHHRRIVRDALLKTRDHAHEILLDAEVALYARNNHPLRRPGLVQRLENPLAKLFILGDDMVSMRLLI